MSHNGEGSGKLHQFVTAVCAFSSQYGSVGSFSYSMENLCGPPTQYPNYGDFVTSAALGTYGRWWQDLPCLPKKLSNEIFGVDSVDFVDVEFSSAVYPLETIIFETFQPGAVTRISALIDDTPEHDHNLPGEGKSLDQRGRPTWQVLWQGSVTSRHPTSRRFNPPLRIALYRTKLLRIEFNSELLTYFTGLDSIELVGTVDRPSTDELLAAAPGPIYSAVSLQKLQCIRSPEAFPAAVMAAVSAAARYETDELTEESYSDSCRTPLLSLPEEILLQLLAMLDLVSLRRLSRVCVKLRYLCSNPALYQVLDLRIYWYLVDYRIMEFLMSVSGVTRLELSWCGNYGGIDSASFCSVASLLGSTLLTLRVDCCDWFDGVCLKWTGLFCRSLEELSMSGCTVVEDEAFWNLQYLCSLRSLDLSRTCISVGPLTAFVQNATCLQHLALSHCTRLQRVSTVCAALAQCCPGLRSLVLWRVPDISWQAINLLVSCGQLQNLDLGWCRNALHDSEVPMLAPIFQYLPNLIRLDLSSLRFVQDGDILQLATSCRSLQQLVLLGADLVHPFSLERLLAACATLRLLDVSYCTHVTNDNVQQWCPLYPNCQIYYQTS